MRPFIMCFLYSLCYNLRSMLKSACCELLMMILQCILPKDSIAFWRKDNARII